MDHLESDIESIFKQYAAFSTTGTHPNKMAFCPIHGEMPGKSKPSLCVNIETGEWICFAGCGGGGLPQFLSAMGDNKHIIKDKLKDVVPTKKKVKKIVKQQEFLPKAILGLFENLPIELKDDGFDEDVLLYHDIGFDISKNRITYPVFNREQNLLAIVGRREDTQFGKYVPYTEKELLSLGVETIPKYEKGSVFWREDKYFQTNNWQNRQEPIIIVEGFKAALWLVQHGYNNVMALMGTHMTTYHLSTLEGLGKTVILCLDGDKPGLASSVKNGYKLNTALRVLACLYPEGCKQPDDIKDESTLHSMIQKPVNLTRFKSAVTPLLN